MAEAARKISNPGEDRQFDQKKAYKTSSKWYSDVAKFFADRTLCLVSLAMLALVPLAIPEFFDWARILFIAYFLFYWLYRKDVKAPLRVPAYAKVVDKAYHSRKAGVGYKEGDGICYLGSTRDNRQIWINASDMKTHMLIFGTTGSGKTVTLQALAYNAFTMTTGLTYIDPKGDPKLAHQLLIVARMVCREDDYLAMNFMTGGRKIANHTPFRMSNTLNPFATASADSITNLLSSLLPKEEGGNAVFQQKAQALITALVKILVALRDAKCALPLTNNFPNGIPKGKFGTGMSITTIRDYLDPVNCVALVYPIEKEGNENEENKTGSASGESKYGDRNLKHSEKVRDINDRIARGEIAEEDLEEYQAVMRHVDEPIIDLFKATLSSLNYTNDAGPPAEQQAYLDQFGYAKGYFGQPLASISGTYGHLFNVSSGEIDMYDCLFNRRILVGILPTLEKSPTECESLGKIILASIKNSVAGALGDKLEDKTKTIIGSSFSASKAPGIIVVDEYAAIMMPGFEVILTQARSLGFMAIIATQDYSGMKGKDEKSCNQIIENTSVKLFMKMANAGETWNLAKSMFGQMTVKKADPNNPEESGGFESIDKVNQFDLMGQIEGEFHAFYGGSLIIGNTQYYVPSETDTDVLRINRFIGMDANPDIINRNLALETARLSMDQDNGKAREWREESLKTCAIPEFYAVDLAA